MARARRRSKGKWLQRANASMKRRGTVGSFTKYCGGNVTNECIARGLNSPSEAIRKKARFAKAVRSIARKRS